MQIENIELLNNRSILNISGPDACNFLQRLTTNDILKKQFSYNFILNNQARYISDFFVLSCNELLNQENIFLIDTDSRNIDNLLKILSMYKLNAEVELLDVSSNYIITYSDHILDINNLKTKIDIEKLNSLELIISNQDPRSENMGYRTIFKITDNINKLDYEKIFTCKNKYLEDKYDNVIIDGYDDLIYQKSIVIEYNADKLNAISYDKGCFIGQEPLSRARTQGVIRKSPFKLIAEQKEIDLSNIDKGTTITDSSGQKIGSFCSGYKNKAIAILRKELVENTDHTALINETKLSIVTSKTI